MHDRQAEARAFADVLGGEERIEDARQHVGRDARAVVGDLDDRPCRRSRAVVTRIVPRSVAPDQRLRGVGEQVHEHLVDLAGVAAHAADVAVLLLDGGRCLQQVAQQIERVVDARASDRSRRRRSSSLRE